MPKSRGGAEAVRIKQRIGSAIKAARMKLDLTVVAFGEELDVGQGTVGDWESGRISPVAENLERIVRLSGESAGYFLGGPDGKEDSIAGLPAALGRRLGYRRLVALSHIPERNLLRAIAALIGTYSTEHGPLPPTPNLNGEPGKPQS